MNSYQHNHASLPLFVISLEFHSTCLAFRSPDIRTEDRRQGRQVREIRGRVGDRQAAMIFTGFVASMT